MEYRVGQDRVVGTAICYGLDGLGIKFWWGEIFHTRPDQPYTMGTRSLPQR